MADKNIHSGHRQRLRNRFDMIGMEGWSDHEVLEFMLFNVFKRCDTNELAHRIINVCGSLDSALSATQETLTSIDGVGSATAYYIRSMGEFVRHMNRHHTNGLRLNKANTPRYLHRLFAGKRHECFYIILLDKNMTVLSSELLFEGDFSHINIDIKEILHMVVKFDSAFMIAAHNHPSGVLAPSQADIQTTQILQESLVLFGAKLLEHYIVSGDEYMGIIEYTKAGKSAPKS